MMDGILLVNKPCGKSSHDAVVCARKQLKTKKVGHSGTLDPLATGLLILLVGKATKWFPRFEGMDKTYCSTLLLGRMTTTADIKGEIIETKSYEGVTRDQVEAAFQELRGEIWQLPPMISAVKVGGKRLYQLARQGLEVERDARRVSIYRLEILDFRPPEVEFYMECSKGTYVRQVAEDVGVALGCGACVCQLQRTKIGSFDVKDAVEIDKINESHIRNWTG